MPEDDVVAEAKYLARPIGRGDAPYEDLVVRIHRPRQGDEESQFRGMWTCRCSISGVISYAEEFPGVDSLQALEFAQVIIATYFNHLATQYEICRKGAGEKPMQIPMLAKSLLAHLIQPSVRDAAGQ